MPTLLGEQPRDTRRGAAGREVLVGGVVALPVDAVGTEGPATARELSSEVESVSLFSAPVPAVELASPSLPLVTSDFIVSPSRAMWDAAPSCSGGTAPPPDDANAHKYRETTKRGGKKEERHVQCMQYRYRWRTLHTQQPSALRHAFSVP
ncbi:hypothetical protein NDU88_004126 [Pleurodeles waltl]|uniref:Uncharacterized protein n=1 Tax=Pleurodeles waltl TaxID=8319 RepID=A0AAV7W452_PLEWA|nr:hypothetical protein NDU88_004126 [Pleurodeles waltl]